MSYTAENIREFINNTPYIDNYGEETDFLLSMYYEEQGTLNIENGPTLVFVDAGGGQGDGAPIWVVFSAGEQLFRANGYYSSWDSSEMDGGVEEVKAVQVQRTEYEVVS